MVYIVATLLRKASDLGVGADNDSRWKSLMLSPEDYGAAALHSASTRALMEKIQFEHGGAEYDRNYPDGIPTSIVATLTDGTVLDSGFVMYPAGHARNTSADLAGILEHKFGLLGSIAVPASGNVSGLVSRLNGLGSMSASELIALYDFPIAEHAAIDG